MTSRVDDFGDATQQAHSVLHAGTAPLRRPPTLSWHDVQGDHRVVLTGRAVLGSGAGVDLTVADPTVSRLHAEFDPGPEGYWLRDLGSRNGTFVDGVHIAAAVLHEGARVRVGSTEIRVQYGPATATTALWPYDTFGPLVGRSVAMRELFAQLARVADTESTVLVTGETGTGKELVARAIHDASPRAGQPYVIVDCASLPEHLLEAELFGHAKGAFTGANSARAGAIESAHGGTVFLDEIGEVPLAMQPKLLRVLESRTVRRLGEANFRKVDVRFLSATHRDLRTMVNAGAFREDLYFRLAVLPVTVPPLRERAEDIVALAEHFLRAHPTLRLEPALLTELASRPWLGNVRELRNFIERAAALGPQAAMQLAHADAASASMPPPAPSLLPAPPEAQIYRGEVPLDLPLRELRERAQQDVERAYLSGLLARHARDVDAIAAVAGIDRSYVHKLLKKYNL